MVRRASAARARLTASARTARSRRGRDQVGVLGQEPGVLGIVRGHAGGVARVSSTGKWFGLRWHERKHHVVQHHNRRGQLLGRFFMIIPILAIAGNLARKKPFRNPPEHFPVTGGSSPTCSSPLS